jgi:hypothetical protein
MNLLDPSTARIVAYLDGLQAKVNALWEAQSASGDDIRAGRVLLASSVMLLGSLAGNLPVHIPSSEMTLKVIAYSL